MLKDAGLADRILSIDALDVRVVDSAFWQEDELRRIALYTDEARRRTEAMFREERG